MLLREEPLFWVHLGQERREVQVSLPEKYGIKRQIMSTIREFTVSLAGGFATAAVFLAGGDSSSCCAAVGGGFAPTGNFFAEAAAGVGFVGAGPPVLHLIVALSNASLILAFLRSGRVSIVALRGLSPTIFMRVPKAVAASLRAPSKPSSSKVANVSARGLI